MHRGHFGLERPLCGCHRRRSAARRNATAEDGRAAAERRGGTRGRQPLYRGRQRRQFQQAAGRGQSACNRGRQARAEGRGRRSHERLLHDPPRPLRATGAAALDPGLQDPARHRCDRAGQAAHGRDSLHFRFAPARREQARFHGGAGFPRPGAGQADPRRGLAALPVVRDGRRHRPCRASRDAVRRASKSSRSRLRRRRPPARWLR